MNDNLSSIWTKNQFEFVKQLFSPDLSWSAKSIILSNVSGLGWKEKREVEKRLWFWLQGRAESSSYLNKLSAFWITWCSVQRGKKYNKMIIWTFVGHVDQTYNIGYYDTWCIISIACAFNSLYLHTNIWTLLPRNWRQWKHTCSKLLSSNTKVWLRNL